MKRKRAAKASVTITEITIPVSLLMRTGKLLGFCIQHPAFSIVHPEMGAITAEFETAINAAQDRALEDLARAQKTNAGRRG